MPDTVIFENNAGPRAASQAVRCDTSLCRRISALEPSLPIHPPFDASRRTPCIMPAAGSSAVCLPAVHVLSGWHMLGEDSIWPWFQKHPQVEVRGSASGCFNFWRHADGAAKWVEGWRRSPPSPSTLTVSLACSAKQLTWHPEYAGRYWFNGLDAYTACCAQHGTSHCDVIRSHGEALGEGGISQEATPPFVMEALYGRSVRVVVALRSPVDRMETAFWFHKQLWSAKGERAL
jgi:hypothetical protein